MNRRWVVGVGLALALLTASNCIRSGMWNRPVSMDNRLYFYIAERAASGVPPHVSTPDVKNQLSSLVDAAAISAGRLVGLHDVRSGRIGLLLVLIAGVWGIGFSVYGLGATVGAAALASLSALSFSNLTGHTAVGFNPKILLFAVLAWGPGLLARRSFATAGAVATAAMLCWQPAAIACLATALGALTSARPFRALSACIAGGVAVFLLYESYFAWHGVLAAQLFQSYGLPLGSVHEAAAFERGILFVLFGSEHGIDALAVPAVCFLLFLAGGLAHLVGLRVPAAGRSAAPTPAVVLMLVAGTLMFVFTVYEHQAEPDRFLLCAPFAISIGVIVDRILAFARSNIDETAAFRLEGAFIAMLLLTAPRRDFFHGKPNESLDAQAETARMVAMYADAYGSVWSYGCFQLMGLAHLTNHHPFDHNWDDMRRYIDETTFVPVAHDRMPDVILKCRRLPGPVDLLKDYTLLSLPNLADAPHLYVRSSRLASSVRKSAYRGAEAALDTDEVEPGIDDEAPDSGESPDTGNQRRT